MAACCAGCCSTAIVKRAVMVEIDGEVIRLSKEFLPKIAGDAWTDKRAEVIVGDGIDYVKRAPDASFDAIIVDSTDPIGVGEVLFTDDFYHNCARILTERGLMVNQCGVPFMQADELRETSLRRRKFFPHVTAYVAAVPTYVGGFMTLGWAAKDASLAATPLETIRDRAERRAFWEPRATGRRKSMPGHSTCRRISPVTCRAIRPTAFAACR